MSDIENDTWKKKKKEPFLHPGFIEEPLVDEGDRYRDFDDLHPPPKEPDGCHKAVLWFVWSSIGLAFLLIMFFYWLRWRS